MNEFNNLSLGLQPETRLESMLADQGRLRFLDQRAVFELEHYPRFLEECISILKSMAGAE